MAQVADESLKAEDIDSASSTGSDSGSTEEEERLKRLFHHCDRDGDGFIDRQDLDYMCGQLGLEECCAEDIMAQLGVDCRGLICFEEFALCRQRLMADIEQENFGIHAPSGSVPHGVPRSSKSIPPVTSLYGLLEENSNPRFMQEILQLAAATQASLGQNFMDTLNSLHLVALSALRQELVDLSGRLQLMSEEKNAADKLIARLQAEKVRLQEEGAVQVEQTTSSYEQRVVELHSVIAELQRKLDRHQINVIQEEEGEYDDEQASNRSNGDLSVNENNANDSHPPSIAEIGEELNAELSKVVQQLETAIRENQESRRISPAPEPVPNMDANLSPEHIARDSERNNAASPSNKHPRVPTSATTSSPTCVKEQEKERVNAETSLLHDQLGKQETEIHKFRAQLGSLREERDRLKRKVRELQGYIQSVEAASSPQHITSPAPPHRNVNSNEKITVTKLAELKKLKTGIGSERAITGAEITTMGLDNGKVAEHLSQSLQDSSSVQEALSSLHTHLPHDGIRQFEIELERLQSKIEHLRAQNDVLCLTLEESKALCARLTVLLGKHESNSTALSLAVTASDSAVEVADTLAALSRAQLATLLAHCRAAGLASIADGVDSGGGGDVAVLLQRVQQTRRNVEQQARQLLARLDHHQHHHHRSSSSSSPAQPWEDLSCCNSHTTASTTSSASTSGESEMSRQDMEQRLREHLEQLKSERRVVSLTMLELLESVHLDQALPSAHMDDMPDTAATAQRLDLENAVLMQELMAIKEEKAELKASNYLLLNEKAGLELRLSGKESQEKAYLVTIEHLKSEVSDQLRLPEAAGAEEVISKSVSAVSAPVFPPGTTVTPAITLDELRLTDTPVDLAEAARREKKLKSQVAELVTTLEKLSRNSEHRHQQSAEFVNDLKKANSALVAAYEKSKKKYMAKIRKLEEETAALQKQLVLQHHQEHSSEPPLYARLQSPQQSPTKTHPSYPPLPRDAIPVHPRDMNPSPKRDSVLYQQRNNIRDTGPLQRDTNFLHQRDLAPMQRDMAPMQRDSALMQRDMAPIHPGPQRRNSRPSVLPVDHSGGGQSQQYRSSPSHGQPATPASETSL